jgi:4-hydroxybenzoate polyprenyltransferase
MLAYVKLLRPQQWTKNGFCLAGVLFSGRFTDFEADLAAVGVFCVFCAASSAVYILNDLLDRERDRTHQTKRYRPLAAGTVSVFGAVGLGVCLTLAALAGSAHLGPAVFGCLVLYLANSLGYCLGLKHLALLDVLCIAVGIVLRLLAGVYAVDDLPTTWITLCTFFLAVFLGFAKRRAELAGLIEVEEQARRPVLSKYTVQYLDYLVNSSALMALMCYALFTTTSGKNPSLVVTVPIVFFAIMHYKRLVLLLNFGEEPDRILLRDRAIQISIGLWLLTYFVVMYGGGQLFR